MTVRPAHARSTQTLEHVLTADAAIVRGYARAAADRLSAGPLTLADRDRLLRRGERLGLGRFDANLILAVAERHHRGTAAGRPAVDRSAAARSAARTTSPFDPTPPRRLAWSIAAAAVTLQACIVAGAWWVIAS